MTIKLFCDLNRDWETTARGRSAHRALMRWKESEPALRFAHSFDELVEVAHCRRQDESDAVLTALLRLGAGDDVALRVVLHAVMPGLISHARRFIRAGCTPDEVAAALVAAAWERIRWYPLERRPRSIGANIVLDAQQLARASLFRTLDMETPAAIMPAPTAGWPDPTGRLLSFLERAVRSGIVSAADARLIVATRVQGVPLRELAATEGIQTNSLRRRRLRIEAALSMAAA